MKKIIIVLLLTIPTTSIQAQQALLKLNTGTAQEVYITDIDSLYLSTSKGIYQLNEISEVVFSQKRGKDIALYYDLDEADVLVSFDKDIQLTELKPPSLEAEEMSFENQFQKYRKTHQLGAGLQLGGVLLAVVGLLTEDESFTYLGAAVVSAGLIVELSGGAKMDWEN